MPRVGSRSKEKVMTRKIALAMELAAGVAAIAAAAAITSGKAYADDITIDDSPFVSTTSRAEVRAQLMNRGSITEWTMQFNDSRVKTDYARGQARAEYLAARDEVRALNGEDSGSAYLGRTFAGVNARAVMGARAR